MSQPVFYLTFKFYFSGYIRDDLSSEWLFVVHKIKETVTKKIFMN